MKQFLRMFLSIVAILVVPGLLCLGFASDVISAREWAIGLIIWVVALLLTAIARIFLAKKVDSSNAQQAVMLEPDRQRRTKRDIQFRKIWIGVLVILLPIGIFNGLAHRAWLPTVAGIAISAGWIYFSVRHIKRLRDRLNLINQ